MDDALLILAWLALLCLVLAPSAWLADRLAARLPMARIATLRRLHAPPAISPDPDDQRVRGAREVC